MVIQRNLPVHVWGNAAPGENVTVSFRGETRSTLGNTLGLWNVYLRPGEAGGPFQLTVRDTGSSLAGSAASSPPITLDDVLVGDIWR